MLIYIMSEIIIILKFSKIQMLIRLW